MVIFFHIEQGCPPRENMAVSPARYPNPTRMIKPSTAKGTNPAGKKEKENHEGTCLSEIPHDETVEVLQEGVSYPQPSEEETKEAVQELMNELSVMMDTNSSTATTINT